MKKLYYNFIAIKTRNIKDLIMKRLPKILTVELLKTFNTKRLLAYLKQLNQCEESFEKSDWDINTDLANQDSIQYKETDKWRSSHQNVKAILKNREHIEKKKAT